MFYTKTIILGFFANHFLESAENRLILSEKFDFW